MVKSHDQSSQNNVLVMDISGIKWTVTIMSSVVPEDKEMARANETI